MKTSYEKFYPEALEINGPDFCIIGMMRSGSNYFERLLNTSSSLSCHGEIFNFAKTSKYRPQIETYLGNNQVNASQGQLDSYFRSFIGEDEKRWGFRIFIDHNERVLQAIAAAPGLKKILLKRNLMEAYISLERANRTQQWLLTDENYRAREVKNFKIDIDDFVQFCLRQSLFYNGVMSEIVKNGGQPLVVDYSDLVAGNANSAIENFLGLSEPLRNDQVNTLKQNTRKIEDQVTNYGEVVRKLQKMRVARWVF